MFKWYKNWKSRKKKEDKSKSRQKNLESKIKEYAAKEEDKSKIFLKRVYEENKEFIGNPLLVKDEVIEILMDLCRYKVLQDDNAVALVSYNLELEVDNKPKIWYEV